MAHPRRFRFGVEMQGPFAGLSWAESARRLEAWGYSTLFVPDHFHQGFGPIAAMAAAAAATTTLRVGPMVLACDFRHPAVLARELATIDVLSEGRLEIGLGAGYNMLDYRRSGIEMAPAPVRVGRLIEHTAVLKSLFAAGPTNFLGKHYAVTDLDGTPKPFRVGGPPFIIAGGGRRILQFAATTADIVGINPSIKAGGAGPESAQDALPGRIDEKAAWVRDAAGDRYDEIEFTAWLAVAEITDDAGAIGARLSARFAASPEEVLQSPVILAGSEAEIADRLEERRDRWQYSYFVLQGPAAETFAPLVARITGA
jgi:probable F420-dependent oxidoreductase